MYRIESFLSARLFLVPELIGERIYFVSNLSGHLSLYVMDKVGSVPEPLLPPEIALQNPHLLEGNLFKVFPKLNKILVMIDQDGNEDYKPMLIPIKGGYPEPAISEMFDEHRFFLTRAYPEDNLVYLRVASHKEPTFAAVRLNLENGTLSKIHSSVHGGFVDGVNHDHSKVILLESYSIGDHVVSLWDAEKDGSVRTIYGTPVNERQPDKEYPPNAMGNSNFVRDGAGLLLGTSIYEDTGGLAYFEIDNPDGIKPVPINGIVHTGMGEFNGIDHLDGDRYLVKYNIDGADWAYEGVFDEDNLEINLKAVLIGQGEIFNGVLEHIGWEKASDTFTLSFSTAISPTQIYLIEGADRKTISRQTNEKILSIPEDLLSPGQDASFTSFDGLRVSARLYLPADSLGFEGPRPVVYYIHGGPQSQERPDFAWFSMPLIQFLTLNGFAVFVPNVRGSTGYGLKYTKKVDRDWGGDDRLDHVHAMTEVLPKDARLDTSRAAVVGRSYGGYMTLTLAARHSELWKASCDMFGPYDLITFGERIPETWKPYFKMVIGDPDIPEERADLVERSPRTHIENLGAPMLVIQGKNDPRVVEQESHDLVEHLRSIGKEIDYLMFENEGHDVLKFENRVTCYNAITDFFKKHLKP
ncbi:MAG: S9 family peptidase [Chloroflexi bacterium]|nr:S9 family peptidase [Chloroflexota bacterium]